MRRYCVVFAFLIFVAMVTGLVGLAGCASSVRVSQGACPSQFSAAVIWSSPTSRNSAVQFLLKDNVVGEIHLDVQGISPTQNGPLRRGSTIVTFATGNVKMDRQDIVLLDLSSCQVTVTRVKVQSVLNLASHGDDFVTVGNLNGTSFVQRYGVRQSQPTASVDVPRSLVSVAAEFDGLIYAESWNVDSLESTLLVLRGSDLSTVDTIPLPLMPPSPGPVSMVAVNGKLVMPIPSSGANGSGGDSRMIVVDIASRAAHIIDLGAPLPFYMRVVGEFVYVAHALVDDSFGTSDSSRHISVVNMQDESVKGYDLSTGISQFDVDGSSMAVLGQDSAGNPILSTYRTADMKQLSKTTLVAPSGVPDAKAMNVFLPPDITNG